MSRKNNKQIIDVGGQSIAKQRSLRQQIRDIRRLLAKDNIPETVRLTKERILKSLQDELHDKISKKQKQKIGKKYRMVKFFEKRKVIRRINRVLKDYSEDSIEQDEKAELLLKVNRLRQELNYIVHFPPGKKYIALYPSSTTGSETALVKQEELLHSIMESVECGDLPDAASQEKSVCLPGGVISSIKNTSLREFSHGDTPNPTDILSRDSDLVTIPVAETSDTIGESLKEFSVDDVDIEPTLVIAHSHGKTKSLRRKQRGRLTGDDDVTESQCLSARKMLREDAFFLAEM